MSSDLKRLLPRNGLTLGPKPQVMCRLARDASVVAALMALGGVDIFDRQFLLSIIDEIIQCMIRHAQAVAARVCAPPEDELEILGQVWRETGIESCMSFSLFAEFISVLVEAREEFLMENPADASHSRIALLIDEFLSVGRGFFSAAGLYLLMEGGGNTVDEEYPDDGGAMDVDAMDVDVGGGVDEVTTRLEQLAPFEPDQAEPGRFSSPPPPGPWQGQRDW